ncbi:MAG: DevR family CRISPR-associated autoregulator [Anaerolineae bacterium]|nr:DevR family CRISPR-associated autoregulator [Anaerolineae bacterium]
MSTPVYAISISAQAILDLHSLNNEGSEGNQTQTRMVDVLTRNGDGYVESNVNAISGDMFKHMQASHLHRIVTQRGLPVCRACQKFDANRISADPDFRKWLQEKPTQVQVIDYMLGQCTMDDLMGNLITEGNLSTPRKSIAEFGWIVALPDHVSTSEYFHAKYVPDRRAKPEEKDEREGNLGQAIFHRPASSGAYAMVCHLETARIGYNDVTQTYHPDVDRHPRYQALLESLLYTFLEPGGAMRNTQLPHIVEVRGAVSVSYGVVPAPALSPLDGDFIANLEGIAGELNQLHGDGTIAVYPFENLTGLSGIIRGLIESTVPYELVYQKA